MEKHSVTPPQGKLITVRGHFDLDTVYANIFSVLEKKDYDIQEQKHSTRMKKKGEETEIKIDGTRDINDFIQFAINIFIRTRYEHPRGEGRLLIRFDAALNLDYMDQWKGKKLKEFVFDTFKQRIKKLEIENYEVKLLTELGELIKEIKEPLRLEK